MATKRISQLTAITSPDNADLFLLTDTSETQSKKITYSALKSSIFDSQTFISNQGLMVTALNSYNPNANGSNTLNATSLFYDGAYRTGSYFLTYANLSGKPTIPSNLSQLTNSTGFVRYSTTTGKMIFDGATTVQMTSDFINEGNTNLFYTNARADARVNQLFGGLFNVYNSSFDQGDVRDSLTGVTAAFVDTTVSGGLTQSKTIRSTDLTKRGNFSVNQVLRLFGASTGYEVTANSTTPSLAVEGFQTAATGTATYTKMSYKVAEFDIESGEIAPATAAQDATIKTPVSLGANPTLESFNSTNFIRLTFTGTPVGKGLAVYRQVANTGDYKLIAVLGRRELDTGAWIDYYNFDYTAWSGKASDNSFTSIIHFPLTAPTEAARGWVDKTITAITDTSNSFDITLDDFVFVNTNLSVSICHNDTGIIRNAILANSTAGKKSIVLNAKIYNSSQITLPNNFGLVGTPYITKIKKLPWSGGEAGTDNAKLIVASSVTNATSISIVGIDIDGNSQNQFLFPDSTTVNKNYLLDFGIGCNSLLIDKVRVTNLPAGGLYATSSIQLKINTSEFVDSGLTDRYSCSPVIADAGQTTIITGNRFENFSKHIDLSVTNRGVFANNIVSNCGDEQGFGVYIYGSVFFLSSPNILIGPAGEFLPTPDILNSEYDLINIDLYQAAAANTAYQSPNKVYQENGAVFNLTKTDGSISSIEYRAYFISKNAQGVEEIYGTTYTPANLTSGKRYTILSLGTTTQAQWNTVAGTSGRIYVVGSEFICAVPLVGTTFTPSQFIVGNTYDIISLGTTTQAQWNIIAGTNVPVTNNRIYAVGSRFVCAAVGTGTGTATLGAGTATSGSVDGIIINDRPAGLNKALGQFAFDIPSPTVQAIKTANGAYSNTTLKAANPLHQGIGWSASYRYEVTAATISGSGQWTADTVNGTSPTYTITTLNTLYLSQNQRVIFKGATHVGWANASSVFEGIVQTISSEVSGQRTVVIKFPGAGGGTVQLNAVANGLIAGTGGSLNIIDNFVMAQGRIT
jgi:hypothetical protein